MADDQQTGTEPIRPQPRSPRIVFMGTPAFATPTLEQLLVAGYDVAGVVTQPDRPAGRGRLVAMSPVKQLAVELGLPVYQPERLRAPGAVEPIAAWRPDLIVVVAFGQILPTSVLALPRRGCLNVHASLLPALRGAAPINAAILAGLDETGVTIMLMDEGLDTGPILSQRTERMLPTDTAVSLGERLARAGAALLVATLPDYLSGHLTPRPQDDRLATYARRLTRADGEVDWSRGAGELMRRWRAYQPWPGLFTYLDGQVLKLLAMSALPHWRGDAVAGQALLIDSRSPAFGENPIETDLRGGGPVLAVATGAGALVLEKVQLEGRRPVTGMELVRGQRGLIGSVLGR